jgi:hypothetical protein
VHRSLGVGFSYTVTFDSSARKPFRVAPTLSDLREGRDAAIEAAREWITSGKCLPSRVQPLS